jgi:hypothetical protein
MSLEASNSVELSNSTIVIKFGGWLKDQRVGLGISLREAAWRSGISLQRLASIESGTLQFGMNSVETSMVCRTYKITSGEFLLKASGQI